MVARARKPRFRVIPAIRVRTVRAVAVGGPAAVMASVDSHHFEFAHPPAAPLPSRRRAAPALAPIVPAVARALRVPAG